MTFYLHQIVNCLRTIKGELYQRKIHVKDIQDMWDYLCLVPCLSPYDIRFRAHCMDLPSNTAIENLIILCNEMLFVVDSNRFSFIRIDSSGLEIPPVPKTLPRFVSPTTSDDDTESESQTTLSSDANLNLNEESPNSTSTWHWEGESPPLVPPPPLTVPSMDYPIIPLRRNRKFQYNSMKKIDHQAYLKAISNTGIIMLRRNRKHL